MSRFKLISLLAGSALLAMHDPNHLQPEGVRELVAQVVPDENLEQVAARIRERLSRIQPREYPPLPTAMVTFFADEPKGDLVIFQPYLAQFLQQEFSTFTATCQCHGKDLFVEMKLPPNSAFLSSVPLVNQLIEDGTFSVSLRMSLGRGAPRHEFTVEPCSVDAETLARLMISRRFSMFRLQISCCREISGQFPNGSDRAEFRMDDDVNPFCQALRQLGFHRGVPRIEAAQE